MPIFMPFRNPKQRNMTIAKSARGSAGVALEVQGDLWLNPHGSRPIGLSRLSRRYELAWVAGEDGLPSINASIGDTVSHHFEVLGSGGSADDVTYNPEGGLKLETDGGGTNGVYLLPHLDAGVTPWTETTWGIDQETWWEAEIKSGSAVSAAPIYHAGLKLTNTNVVATDDHQAFFRAAGGSAWHCIYSIAGVDTDYTTDVTLTADTVYHLQVLFDAARFAYFYINDRLVYKSGAALTTAIDLIPYIGITEASAAAKHMFVRGQAISRNFA